MGLALSVALASVAAGILVGWLGGSRPVLFGPVRTFALVTSVAVALAQLLPDALGAVGLGALGAFAVGLVVPPVFERLATKSRDVVGLEIGFAGLLLHKVGDGLALGAYTGPTHEGHGHAEVLVGIAGHTVPIVALVFLVYAQRRSIGSAFVRSGLLAAGAAAGVLLAGSASMSTLASAEPWITATVAGMLLHVVFHDWRATRDQTSVRARRAGDLIALAVGAALVVLGGEHGHAHGEGHANVRAAAGTAFGDLVLETAPVLLIGLGIGAAIQVFGARIPTRWLVSGSSLRQAVRGSVVGAPLPICACGVLPIAESLRRRGAGAALVVAFLLATPELGVETLALTGRFFGWPYAIVRLGSALLVAMLAALLLARFVRGAAPEAKGDAGDVLVGADASEHRSLVARWLVNLEELLHHVGPWTLIGLVAAAYVQAVVSADAFEGTDAFGLDVIVVSAIAVPSYVCAASATPLGAVLLAKGMSPGAVLAGLLLGPATNLATVGFLRGAYGTRAALASLAGLVVVVWALAFAVNASGLPVVPLDVSGEHGPFAWAATALLLLLVVRSVWRDGLRAWLGSLGQAWPRPQGHGHGQGLAR